MSIENDVEHVCTLHVELSDSPYGISGAIAIFKALDNGLFIAATSNDDFTERTLTDSECKGLMDIWGVEYDSSTKKVPVL